MIRARSTSFDNVKSRLAREDLYADAINGLGQEGHALFSNSPDLAASFKKHLSESNIRPTDALGIKKQFDTFKSFHARQVQRRRSGSIPGLVSSHRGCLDYFLENQPDNKLIEIFRTILEQDSASLQQFFDYLKATNRSAALLQANPLGFAPIKLALKSGNLDTVGFLIDFGFVPTPHEQDRRFFQASETGRADIVALMLRDGPDGLIDATDASGRTALMLASREGHAGVVDLLIERAAELNITTFSGDTALAFAAESGHAGIVKKLLCYAKLYRDDARNIATEMESVLEALAYARQKDHREILTLLLDAKKQLQKNGLFLAAKQGDFKTVRIILMQADKGNLLDLINSRPQGGGTALMRASKHNQAEVVEILIENGAELELKNIRKETALIKAARAGADEACRTLIEAGADIFAEDCDEDTPLAIATEGRHLECVKLLLQREGRLSMTDNYFDLLKQTKKGNLEKVKKLLKKTGDVRDKDGNTPLMAAILERKRSSVETLIDAKADVNAFNNLTLESPLEMADALGDNGIVEHLLESKADIRLYQPTQFYPGACSDRFVKSLIAQKNKADESEQKLRARAAAKAVFDAIDANQSPEHHAFNSEHLDLDLRDGKGRTPLMAALDKRRADLFILFVAKGASLDVRDALGRTPLTTAILSGCLNLVDVMIHHGADLNLTDGSKRTPLTAAISNGCSVDLLKHLIDRGANPNMRHDLGQSPLTAAFSSRRPAEVVQCLIDHEADVTAVDGRGMTPLAAALNAEQYAFANYFQFVGATL